MRALAFALAFAVAWLVPLASARADVVDDAFAAGNVAAAQEDWPGAVEHYRRALSLSAEPSATLTYDLGTAYLHLGDLGRATLYLRRVLEVGSGASAELMERARFNVQIARRLAEVEAAASGAKIDRPETWWDLVLEALRAPGIAWLSLVAGWSFVLVLAIHRRRRARHDGPASPVTRAILVVSALVYAGPGVLHGLAVRAERTSPHAIVVQTGVAVHDGPGNHRKVEFTLQAASRVRLVDQAPGWRRVALPGGLEGWVPETAVARLDARGVSGDVAPGRTF